MEYVLGICSMPSTAVGKGNIAVNETSLCSHKKNATDTWDQVPAESPTADVTVGNNLIAVNLNSSSINETQC